LSRQSAARIAEQVRSGQTSAAAVIDEALAALEAQNPALNAFTLVLADRARAQARRLDQAIAAGEPVGPLAGVPFAVKNLFDIEGHATVAGSKIKADAPPAAQDAPLIQALTRAGAILIGALNMDEFAYGFVTENAHYGPTHNPHDLKRIAGGSSGGSAAAVAAGIIPLSLGSDTNGSVRVPAALCGVFGLKPTLGRLSVEGMFPFVESLDHAGLFAGAVEDLMLAYDLCAFDGAEHADAVSPRATSLEALPLKVGVLGGWFTQGAASDVLAALDVVARALGAEEGVHLAGAQAARSAAFCMSAHEGGRLHLADLGRQLDDFDPAVGDRLLAGALLPETIHAAAVAYRTRFRAEMDAVFKVHDLLIAPATPCSAPLIGQSSMLIDGQAVSVRKNLGAYTQPLSFAGVPVLAAPVNRPGLAPIGVQLVAAPGREDLVFAAALRLQRAGVIAAHAPGAMS
jgi:aspartyl-tRNA(Asn)/glutamyl-tRNA(Gln) amidotransferase subunit A